jgi:gliding motility-associated-like protein
MQRLLLVFILLSTASSLWAQLPPNQPEQDCINAIAVCEDVTTVPVSYTGRGLNANEISGANSCLTDPMVGIQGETNTVWYSFTAQNSGNVCFLITPRSPLDNYDWAVYDISRLGCSGIFSNPQIEIACNADPGIGCGGATGASGGQILCTNQDEPCLPVTQGNTYVIAINNMSGSANGFTLDFNGSTAVVADDFDPEIVDAEYDCAGNEITIQLDERVLCSSVSSSDWALTGPGGPYTITSWSSPRCNSGDPVGRQFTLGISPGFQGNGLYTISFADTVLDQCGNFGVIGSGHTFRVLATPPAMRFATNFCSNSRMTATLSGEIMCNSVDASDFVILGPQGDTFNIATATGVNCQNGRSEDVLLTVTPPFPADGFYTVKLVGTLRDSCGNESVPSQSTAFVSLPLIQPIAAPDTVCAGLPVTLDAGITGPFRYQWAPANVRSRVATVFPTSSTLYTVTATDTLTGCNYTGSVQVVSKPVPTASFTVISPICKSQTAIVNFNGNAGPGVGVDWDLDGAVIVAGDTNTVGQLSLQWNTPGQKTITLELEENGCFSNVFSQTVTVFDVPTASFSFTSPVCINDSVKLTYTGNASANSSYIWLFDGGRSFPSVNGQQGPYNVTWNRPGTKTVCMQVQENGCVSNQTCRQIDVLPPPVATIAPVADVCFDGGANAVNFQYTGPSNVATIEWFFGPTASRSTATGPTPPPISFATPGNKTVKVVVARGGCLSDTASVTFEVLRDPSADFSINQASGTVCAGDVVTFTRNGQSVSPSEVYVWNFGQNANPAISNLLNPGNVTYSSGGTKTVTLIVRHGPGCEARVAKQLVVQEVPAFSAGPDVRFCEGTGGASLNGTTTGGLPGYTWQWTCDAAPSCGLSSSIVEDPLVNPNGIAPDTILFTGFATDARGCRSNIDEVKVIIDAKPKVDAGPDVAICEDGPGANLQASLLPTNRAPGPFSWEWRDDAGNVPPAGMTLYQQPGVYTRPAKSTLYTIVVTDNSTGCTSEVTTIDPNSTVLVRVLPKPIANAGPDTVLCLADTIKLRGSASSGEGNYVYAWTPTNPAVGYIDDSTLAEPSISPFQTTIYTLVVTASGCTSDGDDVLVTVHTQPTAEAGDAKVICFGDSVELDGSASGVPQNGVGYSFDWTPPLGLDDPGSSTPMASPGATQVYQLQVTSDFGCGSDVDNVQVTVNPVPVVEVTSRDTVICEGETVLLSGRHTWGGIPPGTPNVIYEWRPGGQIDGTNRAPVVVAKPTETTEYILETTQGACSSEDRVLVTVTPDFEASIFASDTVICSGETITLQAIGGLGNPRYTWSPATAGVVDPTAEITQANPARTVTYRVVLEEGACSAEALQTIVVNATPVADYFASETEGCAGLEVSFLENAIDGIAYIWDFGDGTDINNEENPVHVFSESGSYPVTLTVLGAGGCSNTITKETISISGGPEAAFTTDPLPAADNAVFYLPDAQVQFLNGSVNATEYLWDFGDGNYSRELDPLHTYREAGLYTVVLTAKDGKGCVSVDSLGIYEVRVPGLVIPNIFTPNGDGINDEFQVIYEGGENYELKVFDRMGAKYFQTTNPMDYWMGQTINGSEATEGVYFYSIQIGDKSYNGTVTLLR